MKKIFDYLSQYKKFFLFAIFIGIILSVVFLISKNKKTTSVIPQTSIASWNGLIPGTSSEKTVIDKLGPPEKQAGSLLYFKSKSPARKHEVIINNSTADFFKEIVAVSEKRTSEEITSVYGSTQQVLYGPDAVNGYYLFVYPDHGIAYLGNPITKSMLEVWYFSPLTLDQFITKWATGYSKQMPRSGF